jgi:hypothetical protein
MRISFLRRPSSTKPERRVEVSRAGVAREDAEFDFLDRGMGAGPVEEGDDHRTAHPLVAIRLGDREAEADLVVDATAFAAGREEVADDRAVGERREDVEVVGVGVVSRDLAADLFGPGDFVGFGDDVDAIARDLDEVLIERCGVFLARGADDAGG